MLTTLSLTWDGGWSHGCPGDGRVRIDSHDPAKARHLLLSCSDRDGAHLGELIPSWSIGDAVAVESGDARLVGLIIGPIVHKGAHYRIPVAVRSVAGGFIADARVDVTHAASADLLTVSATAAHAPAVHTNTVASPVSPPESSAAFQSAPPQQSTDAAALAAANAQIAGLRDVLDKLLNDPTQIIAAEGKAA